MKSNLRTKDYITLAITMIAFVAIPITIYVANQPQEARSSAQQVTTPRPTVSPTPTPTIVPAR